jgi:hypothetical protein
MRRLPDGSEHGNQPTTGAIHWTGPSGTANHAALSHTVHRAALSGTLIVVGRAVASAVARSVKR